MRRKKLIERHGRVFRSFNHEWEIGDLVGQGGMACVFDAVGKTTTGGSYVIKIGVGQEMAVERSLYLRYFTAERLAQAEQTLGHPIYIPRLIDHGRQSGTDLYFIVLEKMTPFTGPTPLPPARFKALVGDLLFSLKYLHSLGLYHGDIKHENVLMKDGHHYLADFGIAQQANNPYFSKVPRERHVDGTLEYAGRDMHRTGFGPSFRADLDNMILCMVVWAGGTLPWRSESDPVKVYSAKFEFFTDPDSVLSDTEESDVKTLLLAWVSYSNTVEYGESLDFERLFPKPSAPACDFCRRFSLLKSALAGSSDIRDRAAVKALKYLKVW